MQSIQDRLKNARDNELTGVFKDLCCALEQKDIKDIKDSLEYVRVRIQQVRDGGFNKDQKYTVLTECISTLGRIKEMI